MTKRQVDVPPAVRANIERTVEDIDTRLAEEETAVVVGEVLADLFGDSEEYGRYQRGESLPPMTRMRVGSYDPRNVLIETEHWAEQELSKLQESKCLRYLWAGFDRSPLSNNIAFALPFRQMLADHLFAEAGEGLRLFGGIKIQCGHNVRMGDNVVVHNDVLLDDRGELTIGDRVSVADNAHIHTHAHDTVDQTEVTTYETILEDDVRLGYGSMVSAGCRVGENAMVGSGAKTLGDVPAHHIVAGSPAKSVKIKPGWESVAADLGPLEDNREQRRLDREFPEPFEEFDEFGRDLSPPGAG
ncbi:acyltransferase [Halovenus sp. WSH3]|uniref:Acyltransferase n=1 Tax=Halovenus carboxidivorans TaxID=2692199 RepID=A0A6B0T9W6_9EURY|nr:acyltransferase [Halovenus carboxidivorans]MXR51670.1 acyltransferase [Halovenus carboxidivorans]